MKKFITFISSLALMCVCTAVPSGAITETTISVCAESAEIVDSGMCGDNLNWELNSEGELRISGKGDMYDFDDNAIPWHAYSITIEPITTYVIKKVIIEDGVTSIGNRAFDYCASLTSVTIPDSVTSIGYMAFCNCAGLTSVTIPDSVTSIGVEVFGFCLNLESVTLSNNITSIDENAFLACKLTSVTIPDSVESIGDRAFAGCENLTSITIPENMTSISDMAFYECKNLKDIYFQGTESQWEKIEIGTDNDYLMNADIHFIGESEKAEIVKSGTCGDNLNWELNSEGVLRIFGTGDMYNYGYGKTSPWDRDISEVIIEDGVTKIGYCAFGGCSGLKSVKIPEGVTGIVFGAFNGCSSLTNINIPDSVTSIGIRAFEGCSGLTSIDIPDSVTGIGDYAFEGCTGLTSITIPDSVKSIEDCAFGGCNSLTNITIPDSMKSIGNSLFDNCTSLTSITIPDSVTIIEDYAFEGCTVLTSVTIPESVTYIGKSAFEKCSSLKNVYYQGTESQWEKIKIDNLGNTNLKNANIHFLGAEEIIYGDVNGDGEVNISDAVRLMQFLANSTEYKLSEQALKNADVINDGGVTALDALAIQMVDMQTIKPEDFPLDKLL